MPSTQQTTTPEATVSHTEVREDPLQQESMSDPLRTSTPTETTSSSSGSPNRRDEARHRQLAVEAMDTLRTVEGGDGSIDFLWRVRAAKARELEARAQANGSVEMDIDISRPAIHIQIAPNVHLTQRMECRHDPSRPDDGTEPAPEQRSTKPSVDPEPPVKPAPKDPELARQASWKRLIKVRTKLASVEKYTWDSCNLYAVEHNRGGASAETYGRYEKAYRKIWTDSEKAHTRATQAILKVSDGSGNPTASTAVIDKHHTALRVTLAGLQSDLDLFTVRGENHRSIQNAESAITAAEQLRGLLKKTSTLTLKLGLIGLGVPPTTADLIAKQYGVLLDTVDEVVGNRLILQGQAVSGEAIATIFALNCVKLVIDELAGAILDRMKGASDDGVKLLYSKLGGSELNEVLKSTIDRAYINAPGGPTLTPDRAALWSAFKAELLARAKQNEEIAKGGWDNPAFTNWLTDTAFDSVDLIATRRAQGGGLPSLSMKKK
jgi:hypothetical protein